MLPVKPLPCENCQQPRPMGETSISVRPNLRATMSDSLAVTK